MGKMHKFLTGAVVLSSALLLAACGGGPIKRKPRKMLMETLL